MYEEFYLYAFLVEGSSYEVENLVTHLIVTCDDDTYVSAAKSLTYRKLLGSTVTFFHVSGVTVTVTVLPYAVVQEPVWLVQRNRRQPKASRVLTNTYSFASLISYQFFLSYILNFS